MSGGNNYFHLRQVRGCCLSRVRLRADDKEKKQVLPEQFRLCLSHIVSLYLSVGLTAPSVHTAQSSVFVSIHVTTSYLAPCEQNNLNKHTLKQ